MYLYIYIYIFANKYIPCFATITLDTASGTLVPAARKVMPITESGIFSVSPERNKIHLYRNFKPNILYEIKDLSVSSFVVL